MPQGLLGASLSEDALGLTGLADAAGSETARQLKNYNINAAQTAGKFKLVGEGVGTAIGAMFGQPGLGYQIGKKAGGDWGGVFGGTGPGGGDSASQAASGADKSATSDEQHGYMSKMLGSLGKYFTSGESAPSPGSGGAGADYMSTAGSLGSSGEFMSVDG